MMGKIIPLSLCVIKKEKGQIFILDKRGFKTLKIHDNYPVCTLPNANLYVNATLGVFFEEKRITF